VLFRSLYEVVKRDFIGSMLVELSSDHKIHSEIIAPKSISSPLTGTLIDPAGNVAGKILYEFDCSSGSWKGGTILSGDSPKGIWKISAQIPGIKKAEATFVLDAGIWASGNMEMIYSDGSPKAGKSKVDIFAGRGERESFQLVITSQKKLSNVKLEATELVQTNGDGRISSTAWTFERVVELYVGITHPSPVFRYAKGKWLNSGNYPDPIISWRDVDIQAGKQQVCLASINIPRGIPAGVYSCLIKATADEGIDLILPIQLEVFDFDMPQRPTFKVLIGSFLSFVSIPSDRKEKFGKDPGYYFFWDKEATDALAIFIAEKGMTPILTGTPLGTNAIPWTYDVENRIANLDFTRFDKNAHKSRNYFARR